MPKKAVAVFFLLAFLGAVLFVFFTFPRSKNEIPRSNNQRPFPSAPDPNAPSSPGGVPVPETVPRPDAPKVPPGPTLRVMAWASAEDARRLSAETDAFAMQTGRQVSLTLSSDETAYRRDLQQALAASTPPDLVFVSSRDFSGLDPGHDLADALPVGNFPSRSLAAFTVDGNVRAVPDEFSVDLLFFNPLYFDQAGIAYPDQHWNWDILEADTRALASLHLKDATGQPVFAVELVPDFDLWNLLCAQAGRSALDVDEWHVGEAETKQTQLRGLELIRNLFQTQAVTAPLGKAGQPPGSYFARKRAALLIGPSDVAATWPANLDFRMTLVPRDQVQTSVACVHGWSVLARSGQIEASRLLAGYLAYRPVHMGWTSVDQPVPGDKAAQLCHQALSLALVPRVDAQSARLAQSIDREVGQLARNQSQTIESIYAHLQAANAVSALPPNAQGRPPIRPEEKPKPRAEVVGGLRDL